jgi:hypothetical protein
MQDMIMRQRRVTHFMMPLLVVGLLGGCSSRTASPDAAAPSSSYSSIFGRLLSFNKATPTADAAPQTAAAPKREEEIDCPEISVQDGTSAVRIYAGAQQSNDNVRYQFSLGELARECRAEGKDLKIKVGISGLVLMGPAGASGNFVVPVRVVVRHDADQKPMVSELYNIDASLKAGESQTSFVYVTPILTVPHTRPDEDQVYTIFIGFDTAAKAEKSVKSRTSRKQ